MKIKITLGIGHNQPRVEEVDVMDLGHTDDSWRRLHDDKKRNAIWELINEDQWLDLGYQELPDAKIV